MYSGKMLIPILTLAIFASVLSCAQASLISPSDAAAVVIVGFDQEGPTDRWPSVREHAAGFSSDSCDSDDGFFGFACSSAPLASRSQPLCQNVFIISGLAIPNPPPLQLLKPPQLLGT